MKDLIERLEKATGPDRELDRDISRSFEPFPTEPFKGPSAWDMHKGMYWAFGKTDTKDGPKENKWGITAAHYTGSIDSARTLLPWKDHPGATFTSKVIKSARDFYHFVEFTWPSTERQGRARTEPLATCICALLAIQETERQMAPYRDRKIGQAAIRL